MNNDTMGVGAMRSMLEPGTAFSVQPQGYSNPIFFDTQVGHMNDFKVGLADNGHVHSNSGIPSKAFALASQGDQGPAYERVGLIWFKALEKSPPDINFEDFARLTMESADELFPGNGDIANIVAKAWTDVGVNPNP